MPPIEDRPTLPERYARSIESNHLGVIADERCSVDMLIAAGWARESLGTALFRLRAEFDQVRGQQHHAQRSLMALAAAEQELRVAAAKETPGVAKDMMTARADHLESAAATEAITARGLILSNFKTLGGTKQALGAFAVITATRERFMQNDAAVMKIAGRALDAWLDPLCPHCNGTGAVGGYGTPRTICTHCHGSTRRDVRLGADQKAHDFGRSLLTAMDRKTDYVTGQMRRFLSSPR